MALPYASMNFERASRLYSEKVVMGENEKEPTEKEIAKRRDDILKRMHKMPPKPHKDIKGESKKKATGKRRGKTAKEDN